MKNRLIIIIFSGLLCLAACASGIYSDVTQTGVGVYPPLNEKQLIRVCLTEESIDNFEEIGILKVYSDTYWAGNFSDIVEQAKTTAREKGANCIILINNTFRPWCPATNLYYYWFRIGMIKG